jgi:hypothetical protein
MRRSVQLFAVLAAFALLPTTALAQWGDNLDTYVAGSGMHGQGPPPPSPSADGGWQCWDNNFPAVNGFVSAAQSHSAPHSAEIRPTTDITQQFLGVNANEWELSGWVYVPSAGTGQQFLILLNTYQHGGPYNWSLDMLFDLTNNIVADFDSPATPPLPLIRGQWVQVRVVINFGTDTQTIFYGANQLNSKSWTEGASGGGALNLDCLDLYSNAGGTIYWDDLRLVRTDATPVEPTTWGRVKDSFRR